MSSTITVDKDNLPPVLQRLVNYRHVSVHICDVVEIGSMQWDGGTRYSYTLVELATGIVKEIVDRRPWPQNMAPIGTTELPAGFVILRHGTFCGKPARETIYARAEDITASLPAPAPELPHVLRQVLAALSQLNSKGRERFRSDVGMDKATWNEHVARLFMLGLCDRRCSLTVEGKNAARDISSAILNPYCPEFKKGE